MIFVDTNVFMYAVGRPHPLRKNAQEFFVEANQRTTPRFALQQRSCRSWPMRTCPPKGCKPSMQLWG